MVVMSKKLLIWGLFRKDFKKQPSKFLIPIHNKTQNNKVPVAGRNGETNKRGVKRIPYIHTLL
jgi:hypothetical protein